MIHPARDAHLPTCPDDKPPVFLMLLPLFIAECKTNLGTGRRRRSGGLPPRIWRKKNKGLAENLPPFHARITPVNVLETKRRKNPKAIEQSRCRGIWQVVDGKHYPKICLTGIEENAREMRGCESKH
jgi:hypothetical protein